MSGLLVSALWISACTIWYFAGVYRERDRQLARQLDEVNR